MKFSSVAFDLDGTLYPNYRFFIRLVPFLLKEQRFLRAMDKARTWLRKSGAYEGDFYDTQARLMAEFLNEPWEKVKERTERLIYRGWEPLFTRVRLYPHVRETLESFRSAGIKLGLLSDFPPETKLKNLKIYEYFDPVICSETVGRLKPDSAPFLELAERMGTEPQHILYVGNSISYDVEGACKAGMKTSLIRFARKKRNAADFEFNDYRQLCDFVLS
jgi:putative hydrolase of the HAD superfamily